MAGRAREDVGWTCHGGTDGVQVAAVADCVASHAMLVGKCPSCGLVAPTGGGCGFF